MILLLSLQWWYGGGFVWIFKKSVTSRLEAWKTYFSVGSLIKTLFAPYKQTFAGSGGSGIGVQFRAWVDRSISRFVGFLIRSVLIFSWIACSIGVLITGSFLVLMWPLIPIFPVASVVFFLLRGLF